MIIGILDTIGCIAGIWGVIEVGRVNKRGYLALMLCNAAYGTLGALQGNLGLLLVSIVMFTLDVYFYIKWAKRDSLLDKNTYMYYTINKHTGDNYGDET